VAHAEEVQPLVARRPAGSVEELVAGATLREPLGGTDGKSGAVLERVVIDGERLVLKQIHPDHDWTMRGFGDLACRPVHLWVTGFLDQVPSSIDHAVVGAATGLGRNGWGAALLLRDVGEHLFPEGDSPISLEHHRQLLDDLAALSAAFWELEDEPDHWLLTMATRYTAFNPSWLETERARGWPDPVPRLAQEGWARFADRAPGDVAEAVAALQRDSDPLADAIAATPRTFLHGDWKLGNLGATPDGRTVLLDWSYPGIGPVLHDLGWYLGLNRARLPESKEDAIDALRASLQGHGLDTAGWWDAQLDLCLLGTLLLFGWEKALGDDAELGWWCERARAGAARL
jgi:hypothetical protein